MAGNVLRLVGVEMMDPSSGKGRVGSRDDGSVAGEANDDGVARLPSMDEEALAKKRKATRRQLEKLLGLPKSKVTRHDRKQPKQPSVHVREMCRVVYQL